MKRQPTLSRPIVVPVILGLAVLTTAVLLPSSADEEVAPPQNEETEEAPPAPPEREEAAPPPDFRPTEEVPFDMGIDFPVDI